MSKQFIYNIFCLAVLITGLFVSGCDRNCGDGYLFLLGLGPEYGGEECDPFDGVAPDEHRIFVTSQTFTGNLVSEAQNRFNAPTGASALNGLQSADWICTYLASLAGLGRSYVAVLSSQTVNAKDRIPINGPIYMFSSRTSRTTIASGSTDLWNGSISTAISRNENGTDISATAQRVWTGSTSSGSFNNNNPPTPVATSCDSWITDDGFTYGAVGVKTGSNSTWIVDAPAVDTCDNPENLYCISQ